MINVNEEYQKWLSEPSLPSYLKEQLENMSQEEIYDAFYADLEFGTAGIRGVLGPGTNRLNVYIVRKATVGFAKYLIEKFPSSLDRGVVISHDNRHFSRDFTLEAAKVLNSYGIKAFIFDSLRPTPELSYAVRYKNALAGIMITASHNPPEYNGYKVYDENGCQLVPQKIARLVEIISSLGDAIDVKYGGESSITETLNSDVDEAYVKDVLSIQLNPELSKKDFKIVFSPQHGCSLERAKDVFNALGYDVTYVEEQCIHNPDFNATKSPNPELPEAFELSIEYAKRVNADLIINTDPDADRLGVAFKDKNGEYVLHTGNQTGALLINYVLGERAKRGLLKPNSTIFDTIVTSSFGEEIAAKYGVKTEHLLTGFKFIGDKIHEYEISEEKTYEFGYEESYGYLIGTFVRDKDSLQAIVMACEMANYYLKQGQTLDVVYTELEEELSFHHDKLYSIYFKGEGGKGVMAQILNTLRMKPIESIDGSKLVKYEDYQVRERYDAKGKVIGEINLPKSNVLKFYFKDGSTIAVRPSGTEPKCKFYYGAVAASAEQINGKTARMHEEVLKLLNIDA
jgi:phosphoglucomutase